MPKRFPSLVLAYCERFFEKPIRELTALAGGDINIAYRFKVEEKAYFIKYNTANFAEDMFQKEAMGLAYLRQATECIIPEVIDTNRVGQHAFLILRFLPTETANFDYWGKLGKALAQLHRISAPNFGLDHDNYIGKLPQSNRQKAKWIDFFLAERLQPQIKKGVDQGILTSDIQRQFERLNQRLPQLLPEEKPSLLHGDLWRGNTMAGLGQKPILIDPAVYFGHREMDLAMTRLFGGFPMTFYAHYQQNFPLEKDYEERLEIYQLYYLLVHVNLFGVAFLGQVANILKKHQ
ncbi:MAG: fructosamine kinase family protein [Saprospiraceae bacterium]